MEQIAKAAFILSQTTCALIELEAMKTTNQERKYCGQAPAYDEIAFRNLIDKYDIGYDVVASYFDS